ncbi:MAG: hypothetical protein ACLRFO_01820 [Alphaproteobacteria bacterium]
MTKSFYTFVVLAGLCGCNSVYVKPNTLDTSEVFYADRGGYSMRRSIKESMESRGYKIVVGKATSNENMKDGASSIDVDKTMIPNNARYIVKVSERSETFRPVWCALNGFWWWNFNVSIADQETGEELLTWRGRGCTNSSIRLLNRILDDMEK